MVTARKREENVQEVPIAVSVITADKLEEAAEADISELQTQVPNLSIYQGRNQSTTLTAFMRGIGQADPLWGVDPGVGLYIDDVYIARPQGALLDVYDVARIEVLRGPQGTLYGKNTIGGAIKYVSRPLEDKTTGNLSFSPGTQGNRDFRGSIAGALIAGKLRGKIAIASLQHNGYGTNLFTGRDVSDRNTLAGHGALEWLVSDKTNVQFNVDATKDKAEPKGYQRLTANPLCPAFGITCVPNSSRFDTQSGLAPLNGTNANGESVVVSSKLNSAWNFKSISAYRKSNSKNNIDFDNAGPHHRCHRHVLRQAALAGVPVHLRPRHEGERRRRRVLLRRRGRRIGQEHLPEPHLRNDGRQDADEVVRGLRRRQLRSQQQVEPQRRTAPHQREEERHRLQRRLHERYVLGRQCRHGELQQVQDLLLDRAEGRPRLQGQRQGHGLWLAEPRLQERRFQRPRAVDRVSPVR